LRKTKQLDDRPAEFVSTDHEHLETRVSMPQNSFWRKTMKNLRMKITIATVCAFGLAVAGGVTVRAHNDDGPRRFSARLSTFNEVPPKGTGATGTFRAKLSEDGTTLNWTFSWSGLTGPPLFAHIHFGQRGVNASVMTFFCGGPNGSAVNPPKPACPQTTSGTITGSTTAADIIALNSGTSDQGLDANDFATFLRALRTGDGYANMHTTRFPGGEIRGQIADHRGDWEDDDD
jgi:CHRD domain